MLEVLLEVPPHGCGGPWPGMAGGVAEWWRGKGKGDGRRKGERRVSS